MTNRGKTIEQLREIALRDTESFQGKQRFGLFSSPIPLAIGDNGNTQKRIPPRDEQGKPVTSPPNIKVKFPKEGKSASSYFSLPKYVEDKYEDSEKLRRKQELKQKSKRQEEAEFKPASGYKIVQSATYTHMRDDYVHEKKVYRDADRKVICAPKNVTTNPACKDLFKFRKHITDTYDGMKKVMKEDRILHHQKLGEKPEFKTTEFGHKNFASDQEAFGLDKPMPPKKPPLEPHLNIMHHEAPFKPSNPPKKGFKGDLEPFPKYMENPLKVTKRIDKVKGKDEFKPPSGGNWARPTPTITCNPINIKREMIYGK